MEFVRAVKSLNHLASLKNVNANCTISRLYFFVFPCWNWFFILECSIGIDNIANLFRRQLFFLFFLLELLGELRRGIVWVKTTFISIRICISIIGSLLELLLEARCPSIESVPIEVHLNVLRVHISHHLREIWKYAIKVWHILHVKVYICSVRHCLAWKLVTSSEVKLKCLMLSIRSSRAPRKLREVRLMMLLIKPSLASGTYLIIRIEAQITLVVMSAGSSLKLFVAVFFFKLFFIFFILIIRRRVVDAHGLRLNSFMALWAIIILD